MFTLKDDNSDVLINPEQVVAVVSVAQPYGVAEAIDIVTTARAMTYRVKGTMETVVDKLKYEA